MKILALFLLIGVASASFHEMLDDASEEFLQSFLEGMEQAPALKEHFGVDNKYSRAVEEETKSEISKQLREALNKILERVKEAIEEGKVVREDFLEKVKDLREKMKDLKVEVGEKGKELLEKIRDRAREYFQKILERLGKNKRAADDRIEEALAELNIRDVLKKIKEHLKNNIDPELLKEKIEKVFGQASELLQQLLTVLKEKGRRKLEMLIDVILGEDDEDNLKKRGLGDYWDKVKNYFKDLKIDLQEKYAKFGEWVKDSLDKGMEHSKDKMENIKAIAKEFAKHAKGISKEVAAEAGEFFRNYKDELGIVWDEIKEKIAEIRKKQD